jgi:16S rRNA U516 pseudouridylate synthase RsuA-like enzyme
MAVKVQGLGVVTSSGTEMPRPRSDQWIQAIEGAMAAHDGQPVGGVLSDLLQHLSSVPRREEQFKNYLRRVVKVEDEHLRSQAWDAVDAEDNRIRYPHGFIAGVPDEVLCAADVASEIAGRRVYVVHRLDMETSGVLLFAKTSSACARLNEQFRDKVVKKTYLAEVAGRWDGAVDRVDLMIRPDLDNRPLQIVDPVGGKECTTLVQVVRYNDNGDSSTNSSTILKLSPITGRTHQLRVHTSALGLPILGDSLYVFWYTIFVLPIFLFVISLCLSRSLSIYYCPDTSTPT